MRMRCCIRTTTQSAHILWQRSFASAARVDSYTTTSGPSEWPPARPSEQEIPAFHPDSDLSCRARQVLRGILRECTYLPDPQARSYISHYALTRFRTYSFKAWKFKDRPDVDLQSRLKGKHKEARQALNLLQRANRGERKPLLRVLLTTYGRIGKRRRDLMLPLMPTAVREAVEAKQEQAEEGIAEDVKHWEDGMEETTEETIEDLTQPEPVSTYKTMAGDKPSSSFFTPQLYALARSQIKTSPPDLTRPNPRSLEPSIPQFNSYLQPLAASRVKNITKKWYAEMMDRLLPPLPTKEWDRLRQFAKGEGLPSSFPQRRKAAPSAPNTWKGKSALEMVLARPKGIVDKKVFGFKGHAITSRSMQRLYVLVFQQCPRIEWEPQPGKGWTVTWGQQGLASSRRKAEER